MPTYKHVQMLVSTGNLLRPHTSICLAVTNQRKEIDSMVASERIHVPIFARNNLLYTNLRGKISSYALNEINKQYQKAAHATIQKPLLQCTGSFSRTMGLPCAHNIQQLDNSQCLSLDNINKHWWIQEDYTVPVDERAFLFKDFLQPLLQNFQERYQNWPEIQQKAAQETLNNLINTPTMVLQDPVVISTRGRPSGSSNNRITNSTKRDLSGFELVEKKGRQCTLSISLGTILVPVH
ncbi:21158_t:CDS:2 [Gigaspora rosea]|nr:21158_t:CDS:2 [Gigaspora rosea]